MGTILASALITRCRTAFQDENSDDYLVADATWLYWLNDGQRAIVLLKPNVNVTNAAVRLSAGTLQTIPTGGIALIKLTHNKGAAGTTNGTPINFVPMEQYNYLEPTLHSQTATPIVEVYSFDTDDPTHFYTFPPQPATPHYVGMVYTAAPTDIATTGTAISLNDIYQGPLVNYMLYRAYALEQDANSSAMSQKYYDLFMAELGMKGAAEDKANPSRKR